jgi:hypothetical protein
MFEALLRYKNAHGHCDLAWREDSQLGPWLIYQTMRYERGTLASDRKERLEAIGFRWLLSRGAVKANESLLAREDAELAEMEEARAARREKRTKGNGRAPEPQNQRDSGREQNFPAARSPLLTT